MLDFMSFDYLMAIGHHILVFALFGVLVAEVSLVRSEITVRDVQTLGKLDLWYGLLALAILALGFSRAIFAAKGWSFYADNLFFWLKIATFILIGVISSQPTLRYLAWRKGLKADPQALPAEAEIRGVKLCLYAQLGLFALLPVLAAAMARGMGDFNS